MSPAREGARRGTSPSLQEGPGHSPQGQGSLLQVWWLVPAQLSSASRLELLQPQGQGSSQGSVEVSPQVPTGGNTEDALISSLPEWEKGTSRASSAGDTD